MASSETQTILVVGASRGLGLGLVQEYLQRGWHVIATVRDIHNKALNALVEVHGKKLEIESIDITVPDDIAGLRKRLGKRKIDLLFVIAGVANDPKEKVGDVATEEFMRVMITNALSPIRVIEAMADLVPPSGTIAVMSSGLASVAGNETGGWEVYRASKAALNTLMRSFAVRQKGDKRTFLAIAPGWVRTDMGGSAAPLDVETSMRGVADAMTSRAGKGGMAFIDYRNQAVAW